MAQFFNYFPQASYKFDSGDVTNTVTNLISRFSFEEAFKENTAAYYKYVVKEGETPESLAHRFYGSSEKHWIILMMNNIIDPFYDWPLDDRYLNEYIMKKYADRVTTERNGLDWAKKTIKSYYKTITISYQGKNENKKVFEIDAFTYYYNIPSGSQVILLSDGNSITESISKETKTYYDYEVEENENKRQIKILKTEFVFAAQNELQSIFNV